MITETLVVPWETVAASVLLRIVPAVLTGVGVFGALWAVYKGIRLSRYLTQLGLADERREQYEADERALRGSGYED